MRRAVARWYWLGKPTESDRRGGERTGLSQEWNPGSDCEQDPTDAWSDEAAGGGGTGLQPTVRLREVTLTHYRGKDRRGGAAEQHGRSPEGVPGRQASAVAICGRHRLDAGTGEGRVITHRPCDRRGRAIYEGVPRHPGRPKRPFPSSSTSTRCSSRRPPVGGCCARSGSGRGMGHSMMRSGAVSSTRSLAWFVGWRRGEVRDEQSVGSAPHLGATRGSQP
jgi:hypothetical protein